MNEAAGINWLVVALVVAWAVITAVVGSRLTVIDEWYFNLEKPGWKPPDWSFGVVWTLVFICSGWAFYRGLTLTGEGALYWAILIGFVINGALNILWNILFFTIKRPDLALPETYALIASVLVIAGFLWPIDKLAAVLMAPYAIWVSIACYLTYEIVQLNKPFAGLEAG